MHFPYRPLTVDEEIEAAELLSDSGSRTLIFARGVFAAAAISPRPMDPAQWLSLLVGEQVPDSITLKRLMTLLVRDAGAVHHQLALGQSITPASEDEDVIREFCKGFVHVAQKETRWTTNQTAFDLTLPMMVLSQYVDPASLATVDPNAATDPTGYRSDCARRLPEAVSALYDFFRKSREEHARGVATSTASKVGRNEPCPCGSGKKYKKCCAL